jgi:uncharacterized membrane protein
MGFSDGTTTIHHSFNVCVNHPDREARNLCVDCGQWFCDDCMSSTHKYLCSRCATEAEAAKHALDRRIASRDRHRGSGRFTLPLICAGLFMMMLLMRKFGIVLIALPLAFFFLIKQAFREKRDVFRTRHTPKRESKKVFASQEEITQEQISALLRIGNGRLTAEKLARATGAHIKTAKKFLDKQVVEGTLSVEAGDSELVYLANKE